MLGDERALPLLQAYGVNCAFDLDNSVRYNVMVSAILVLFVMLLTLLPFINRIEWTVEWGKAIGTIALTDAVSVYNIPFALYQRIIYSFSPVSAMGLSLLLNWMMCSLIGLIMFVFNMSIGHSSGSIICCTITMFNYFIANFLSAQWLRFSPQIASASWTPAR